MLDKLVDIYSVDTSNFYDGKEAFMHNRTHKLRMERSQLVNGYVFKDRDGKVKRIIKGAKEMERTFEEHGISESDFQSILKGEFDFSVCGEASKEMSDLAKDYIETKKRIYNKNEKIKKSKDQLLKLLSNKTESNINSNGTHHMRKLNDATLTDKKNRISVFDSYFTRTIGAQPNMFSDDFMVVKVFFFDMIKDLIYHGFYYKGEKYVYFTSSAGQIRTKKCVFVKEATWKKYEKTLMCGLTIDDINAKGGNNPNKHLAYLALTNSATDVWKEFDIDKTIVIDDFETDVYGTYDLVDDEDYLVSRISDYVPITHTDGAGMMLPNAFSVSQKNMMVRLPWVKGLLGVFPFDEFIKEHGCSSVIKDIYGKEHDVIAEDIQVIFTKSQFKMCKYYDSWDEYKDMYKRYNCSAGVTNIEEDKIKDATINYQMLQSLTDITDKQIKKIVEKSKRKLENICPPPSSIKSERDRKRALRNLNGVLGINPYNRNKSAFQRAIELYPDLLNDEYAKKRIRDTKDSMVKMYRSGKLQVHGKYTFILPDFYAACQYWFMGNENPDGLLDDGEVFCALFENYEELDCLRSPHLYCEHAIRSNVAWNGTDMKKTSNLKKWFLTNAIYTSCKDMISKVLMFDVDGDKALVVSDKVIIEVAKHNLEKYDIVPLYYNMRKAEPVHLDNASIYNGLNAAFVGGNIGVYSNNISKIWNSSDFVIGRDEKKKPDEKKEKKRKKAIEIIKLLCMENNFVIDYAKTLYKPERPKNIHDKISEYTNLPLPHFFKYAKDKSGNQIAEINDSFVNKLESKKFINNPRINTRKLNLGNIDYTLMMSNPNIECKVSLTANGSLIKEETDPIIVKYCEFNKEYYLSLDNVICFDTDEYMKNIIKIKKIYDEIRSELSKFGRDDREITDILVKYLYGIRKGGNKTGLWLCYGDYIVENLEKIFEPQTIAKQCEDCGNWFYVSIFDSATKKCDDCHREQRRQDDRIRKQEQSEFRDTKAIVCRDCGKEFEIGIKDTKTERCSDCYSIYRKQKKLETQKTRRLKNKMKSDQIPQTL